MITLGLAAVAVALLVFALRGGGPGPNPSKGGPCECGCTTVHPSEAGVCRGVVGPGEAPVILLDRAAWHGFIWPVEFADWRPTGTVPHPIRACQPCWRAWVWELDRRLDQP